VFSAVGFIYTIIAVGDKEKLRYNIHDFGLKEMIENDMNGRIVPVRD
jgi:hypothetical protein